MLEHLQILSPLGYSYGCVVRKKVVFLEELKRDTEDFGEFLNKTVALVIAKYKHAEIFTPIIIRKFHLSIIFSLKSELNVSLYLELTIGKLWRLWTTSDVE